jgi:hypothetical protein
MGKIKHSAAGAGALVPAQVRRIKSVEKREHNKAMQWCGLKLDKTNSPPPQDHPEYVYLKLSSDGSVHKLRFEVRFARLLFGVSLRALHALRAC